MTSGSTAREPRQDRARATRARLLTAAVDALAEYGWTATSVAVVAERAGVSRGAAQFHFPTREDMFAAAVEHMGAERTAAMVPDVEGVPVGPERTRSAVRTVVGFYRGPLFRAALQVWAAAASDAALRTQVVPLEAALGADAHRAAVALLGVDEAVPGVREAVQGTLDLARGLALAAVLTDDTARRERVVDRWAAMLHAELVRLADSADVSADGDSL